MTNLATFVAFGALFALLAAPASAEDIKAGDLVISNAWARAVLLMITTPSSMSCKSCRRLFKRPISRIKGVRTETVTQNAIAWTAPSTPLPP